MMNDKKPETESISVEDVLDDEDREFLDDARDDEEDEPDEEDD